MRYFRKFWLIITGLLLPAAAFAGRPLNTEDAAVAGKGAFQVEFSWDIFHFPHAVTDHTPLFVPIYGLTSRLDIMADIPYTFRRFPRGDHLHGWNDVILSAKYLMFSGSPQHPAVAIVASLKTPTGEEAKGLGSEAWEGAFLLALTYGKRRWVVHGMGGVIVTDHGADQISLGVAGEYQLSTTLHLAAELTADHNPGQLRQGVFTGMVGMGYLLSPALALDIGVRRGIDHHAPIWHLTLGSSISF